MIQQTRKQFLKTLGLAAVSGLAMPARLCLAQTPEPNSEAGIRRSKRDLQAAVPSYLRGHETLYRANPRAAAVEWHRNAKWGLFVHYALHSLRGLTAQQALKAKGQSNTEWKRLKQGMPAEYRRIDELYALIRSLQPQCLISFKQGIGTEDFVAPEGRMHVKGGPIAEKAWALNAGKRGDICTNMQTAPPAWLYLEGCEHINADEVLALLADAFAQKANLTLNTGPLPNGSIHPSDVAALREAGARIRENGYPPPALLDRFERKKLKNRKP